MLDWLQNLPEEIVTDRLVIRPHRRGDGLALYEAIADSLDELRRWPAAMGWSLGEQSPEQAEVFCEACNQAFAARTDFPLLITLRGSGTIVGSTGLHRPDWTVPKLEVGWWGRSTYSKQGFVTEAVVAVLDFAFQHLHARRVFALPDDENTASWRICERAGMLLEGVMKQERIEPDGTLRDTRLYSKIA